MKVIIYSCLILSGILCGVKSKAVQSNEGDYGHMYENLYLRDAPVRFSPSILNQRTDFELRYVPHVDGKPIIIPPIDSNDFETPINNLEKQQAYWPSKYEKPKQITNINLNPTLPVKELKDALDNSYEKSSYIQDTDDKEFVKILIKEALLNNVVTEEGKLEISEPFSHDKKHKKKINHKKVNHHNKKNKHIKEEKIKGNYNQKNFNYPNLLNRQNTFKNKILSDHKNKHEYNTKIVNLEELTNKEFPEQPKRDRNEHFPGKNKIGVNRIKGYNAQKSSLSQGKKGINRDYSKDHSFQHQKEFYIKPSTKENVLSEYQNKPVKKLVQINPLERSRELNIKINPKEYIYRENKVISSFDLDKVPDHQKNSNIEELTKKPVKIEKPTKHTASKVKIQGTKSKLPYMHNSKLKSGYFSKRSMKNLASSLDSVRDSLTRDSIKDEYDEPDVVSAGKEQPIDEYDEPDVVNVEKEQPVDEYEPDVVNVEKEQLGDEYEPDVVNVEKIQPVDEYNPGTIEDNPADFIPNDYDEPVVVEALIKKDGSNFDYDPEYEPVAVEGLTKKEHVKHTKNKVSKEKEFIPVDIHKENKVSVNKEKVKTKDYIKTNYYNGYSESDNVANNENSVEDTVLPKIINFSNLGTELEDIKNNDEIQGDKNVQLEVGSGEINERSSGSEDFRDLLFKSNLWSLTADFHAQERNKFEKCSTSNNESGNCMPIQMCPTLSLQLTLNDLKEKVCNIGDVFVGICCPEFSAEALKVERERIIESTSNSKNVNLPVIKECGKLAESTGELNFWPWMAPLISMTTRRIICGGVLISDQYVLTAAHCTRKIPYNQVIVVLGPMNENKEATVEEFEIVEIKLHPLYNSRTMENDIALLKLSRSVVQERSSICIAEDEDFSFKAGFMLSWKGSFVARKDLEPLRIISMEECLKRENTIITENMICTESSSEAVMCDLDSGSPLIIERNGKYEVIGVSTWNREDCDSRFPSLFTKVTNFQEWIQNQIS